jgi:hypothetical protein
MVSEVALELQPKVGQTGELQAGTQPNWEAPSPPTDLIFDDGVPLESNRHRIAMNG